MDKHGTESSSEPPEGTNPADTWILDVKTLKLYETIHFDGLSHQACVNSL